MTTEHHEIIATVDKCQNPTDKSDNVYLKLDLIESDDLSKSWTWNWSSRDIGKQDVYDLMRQFGEDKGPYRFEVSRPDNPNGQYPYRNLHKCLGKAQEGEVIYNAPAGNTPPSAPSQPPQGTEYESPWKQANGTWTQAVEWAVRKIPFDAIETDIDDWETYVLALTRTIYEIILKGPSTTKSGSQTAPLTEDEQTVEDMGAPREDGDFNWPQCKGTLEARGVTEEQVHEVIPSLKDFVIEHPMLSTMEITDEIEKLVKAKLAK